MRVEACPQTVWACSPWRPYLQLCLLLQGLGDDPGCFHTHRVALQTQRLQTSKVFNLLNHIFGCPGPKNRNLGFWSHSCISKSRHYPVTSDPNSYCVPTVCQALAYKAEANSLTV